MTAVVGRIAVFALVGMGLACADPESAWLQADAIGTEDAYRAFLVDHPEHPRAAEARWSIRMLETLVSAEAIEVDDGRFVIATASPDSGVTALYGRRLAALQAYRWSLGSQLIHVRALGGFHRFGDGSPDGTSSVTVWAYWFISSDGRALVVQVGYDGIISVQERPTGAPASRVDGVIGERWTVDSDVFDGQISALNMSVQATPDGRAYWVYDPPVARQSRPGAPIRDVYGLRRQLFDAQTGAELDEAERTRVLSILDGETADSTGETR